MIVRETARGQHVNVADRAAKQVAGLSAPPEGWLVNLRKALGISVIDIAKRLGVSRNAVYQSERGEHEGTITIAQLDKMAAALGGRLVYAIVPENSVKDMVHRQAVIKAEGRIRRAGAHMALENQALSDQQMQQRIDDLAARLARDRPPDFWSVS